MYDTPQEGGRRDGRLSQDVPALAAPRTPPLRLAGVDEDETWEPHVVRGID
ncbi:hypothetical protein AB0M97_26975 [Streptomyces sp. NPDC051207]|uniref:hypothetical protein n=1 Tax=Streptomyces sp. NPDC051207 TaxID=3154641 RepID=UPI0034289828